MQRKKLLAILLLSVSAVINGVVSSCPDTKRIEPCFCIEDQREAVATCSNIPNADTLKRFVRGSDGYLFKQVIIRDSNLDAIPVEVQKIRTRSFAFRNLRLSKWFSDIPTMSLEMIELQNVSFTNTFSWEYLKNTKIQFLRIEKVEIRSITIDFDRFVTHDLKEGIFMNTNTSKIEKDAFKHFTFLDRLAVVNNFLEVLDRTSFPQPYNGRALYFQHNRLTRISDDLFTQMPNLVGMYLGHNNIKRIDEPQEAGTMKNIKTIDVSNNPLNCQCNFYWVVQMKPKNFKGTCSGPEALHGKKLAELTEDDVEPCS